MKYTFLLLLAIAGNTYLHAQARQLQTINSGWQFVLNDAQDKRSLDGDISWQKINLPHTWNALDIIDDTIGYHQGIGWYKKELFIPAAYKDKHVELFFEGACNQATVFVNGTEAGIHKGAFTGFTVGLDGLAKMGQYNEILVKVDNGKYLRDSMPPYSADFNLMGGIYRDVWLNVMSPTHFAGTYASTGVLFETNTVDDNSADFTINCRLNQFPLGRGFKIRYQLSWKGQIVRTEEISLTNPSVINYRFSGSLNKPKLWSPETPSLYELHILLQSGNGELLDEVEQQVGFRSVAISANNEFLLNGKPYKLKGASRHQDYKNVGWAMTNAMQVRDIELMKEMGCNFIRIAHYPQDPVIYEACDRLGLMAWNEIPVVDRVVNNKTFFESSATMMQEMILQNFNHPSIAIWGYHNEVRNLDTASLANARMLNGIAKKLDTHRLTAMAYESNVDAPYFSNPLLQQMLDIPDINGYNVYQGWYRGRHNDIDKFLDTLYAYHPSKPILLSEYGAGSIINMHSYHPSIFDFSEEYQTDYHNSYVKAGNKKPWMIGFAIWNFIDFQRDGREDVVPNINKKGMVTTDRQPKDVYYYYQSQWADKPILHIAGKHWPKRVAATGADQKLSIPITVYSNQPSLSMHYNGQPLGSRNSSTGIYMWNVTIETGHYEFVCTTPDKKMTDVLSLDIDLIDTTRFSTNKSWQQLSFNTGQYASYFTDATSQEQWIPDKRYSKGSWGFVNGAVWKSWPGSAAWDGQREGIHKPIANTDNEPLYQTFVQGLSAWKADVPAGRYLVSVLLSEPFTPQQRKNEERVFNILLNGQSWLQQLNLEKDYGVQSATQFDKIVEVKEGEGIQVDFKTIKGLTLLNAVSIKRM